VLAGSERGISSLKSPRPAGRSHEGCWVTEHQRSAGRSCGHWASGTLPILIDKALRTATGRAPARKQVPRTRFWPVVGEVTGAPGPRCRESLPKPRHRRRTDAQEADAYLGLRQGGGRGLGLKLTGSRGWHRGDERLGHGLWCEQQAVVGFPVPKAERTAADCRQRRMKVTGMAPWLPRVTGPAVSILAPTKAMGRRLGIGCAQSSRFRTGHKQRRGREARSPARWLEAMTSRAAVLGRSTITDSRIARTSRSATNRNTDSQCRGHRHQPETPQSCSAGRGVKEGEPCRA